MAELKDKLVSLEGLQIFYNAFADAGRIPAFDAQNESMVLAIKDGKALAFGKSEIINEILLEQIYGANYKICSLANQKIIYYSIN